MDLSLAEGQTLKIGNKIYQIKLRKSIKNDQLLGLSSHGSDKIWLCTKQSPVSFVDTLLHEIFHCLWYAYGVSYVLDAQEIEEFTVNAFGSGLVTVFLDNPWVLDILKEVQGQRDTI